MAPEVLFGKNHTYSVDFYAMGIMSYEFVFGDRPYEGTSRKELREEIIRKQARIHSNQIPDGWSREACDFINQLMQRKYEKRLGHNEGIKELKNHRWFRGYDWEALEKKKLKSPFVPPKNDNYDKEYCEEIDEYSLDTINRYDEYRNHKNYRDMFYGFTYYNINAQGRRLASTVFIMIVSFIILYLS